MDYQSLSLRIKNLLRIVDAWGNTPVEEIEKDRVLSELSGIYNEIKFGGGTMHPELPVSEPVPELVAPAFETGFGLAREEKAEPEDVPLRVQRSAILSLYDDNNGDTAVAPGDEEPKVATAGAEPKSGGEVVAEELENEAFTPSDGEPLLKEAIVVADGEAERGAVEKPVREPVASPEANATEAHGYFYENPQASKGLRSYIGVDDRMAIVNDLFGGDALRYESALEELEMFDDLNEALIYIHDNYDWNPDSDGARLLAEQLVKKLG